MPEWKPSPELRSRCREILLDEAWRYKVDPALVLAHVRHLRASVARRHVQKRMIEELGMKRHMIARMFGRDLRRVRASVMDKKSKKEPKLSVRKTARPLVIGNQLVWPFVAELSVPPKRKSFGQVFGRILWSVPVGAIVMPQTRSFRSKSIPVPEKLL